MNILVVDVLIGLCSVPSTQLLTWSKQRLKDPERKGLVWLGC